MAYKTGVILVNWNTPEFTLECVRSLLNGTTRPDVIVVVDNASSDDSIARISSAYPEVVMVSNHDNKGFATANNQGIRRLLDSGMDYIWVLNNDTVVSESCLSMLLSAAAAYPETAAFSAKIYRDSFGGKIWYAGAYRHRGHGAPKHLLDTSQDLSAINGCIDVPFISGCCMFVPAWAFRKYGGFIESYFAYYEDSEWCWRVRNAGGKLCYSPQPQLIHKVSSSVKKNDAAADTVSFVAYLMSRNQLWTVRMHSATLLELWKFVTVNSLIQLRNLLCSALAGDYKKAVLTFKAIRDGLFCGLPKDFPVWN